MHLRNAAEARLAIAFALQLIVGCGGPWLSSKLKSMPPRLGIATQRKRYGTLIAASGFVTAAGIYTHFFLQPAYAAQAELAGSKPWEVPYDAIVVVAPILSAVLSVCMVSELYDHPAQYAKCERGGWYILTTEYRTRKTIPARPHDRQRARETMAHARLQNLHKL